MRTDRELFDANRRFYDALWMDLRLVDPERFNTWPLLSALAAQSPRRLEIGPGLRPRLPVSGTCFVDISAPALARLRDRGATTVLASAMSLPFPDAAFDLVCAFDIVEHLEDDDRALAELSRVAVPGRALVLSVPLHPGHWTAFDDLVGHRCRYDPGQLLAKLAEHGLTVERSAAYGMQPRASWLVALGAWWLTHRHEEAMWWCNRVIMPLGLWLEKKLAWAPGMIATERVDEILLVCRKAGTLVGAPA